MFTTDDTEIIPADESGDTPSPNGRALTAEKDCSATGTPPTVPSRFLIALLRALSIWST